MIRKVQTFISNLLHSPKQDKPVRVGPIHVGVGPVCAEKTALPGTDKWNHIHLARLWFLYTSRLPLPEFLAQKIIEYGVSCLENEPKTYKTRNIMPPYIGEEVVTIIRSRTIAIGGDDVLKETATTICSKERMECNTYFSLDGFSLWDSGQVRSLDSDAAVNSFILPTIGAFAAYTPTMDEIDEILTNKSTESIVYGCSMSNLDINSLGLATKNRGAM